MGLWTGRLPRETQKTTFPTKLQVGKNPFVLVRLLCISRIQRTNRIRISGGQRWSLLGPASSDRLSPDRHVSVSTKSPGPTKEQLYLPSYIWPTETKISKTRSHRTSMVIFQAQEPVPPSSAQEQTGGLVCQKHRWVSWHSLLPREGSQVDITPHFPYCQGYSSWMSSQNGSKQLQTGIYTTPHHPSFIQSSPRDVFQNRSMLSGYLH